MHYQIRFSSSDNSFQLIVPVPRGSRFLSFDIGNHYPDNDRVLGTQGHNKITYATELYDGTFVEQTESKYKLFNFNAHT